MRYPWDFGSNREEIEWLRTEVERLQGQRETLRRQVMDLTATQERFRRLEAVPDQAEVERLRAAIRETIEEYPGYEEMDRIAAAIGLPDYLSRAALAKEEVSKQT